MLNIDFYVITICYNSYYYLLQGITLQIVMGTSQQKQQTVTKSNRQVIKELETCVKTLRISLKREVSRLQCNSRKIQLKLEKIMVYSTSDAAKKAIIAKHLKNTNQIQRYMGMDVHLEEALYKIAELKDTQGLTQMVKELADLMGVPYQAMKKVKELNEALTIFAREIGNQIQDYNVLKSDEEEEKQEQIRYNPYEQQKSKPPSLNPSEPATPQRNKMVITFTPPKPSPQKPPVNIVPAPMHNVTLNKQGNSKVQSYIITPAAAVIRKQVTQKDITDYYHKLYPPAEDDSQEKSKNSKEESVKNKKT